jgi:ribosomal protein S27E
MRLSQALDFIHRAELPDRHRWGQTYSHISDFYELIERRKTHRDELIAHSGYGESNEVTCFACHGTVDVSDRAGERIICHNCGNRMQVQHRRSE